jgi:trans-2,3-dihydro-3-hydroxyanthranilate isomerase
MTRQCQVLRVFMRGEVGGNHLGVVNDLTDLTGDDMLRIAAQLGFSETVFVDEIAVPPHCRIFTPTTEMPFAGHPLVGVAWFLNTSGRAADWLTCQIGKVQIDFTDDQSWIATPLNQSVASIEVDAGVLGLPEVVSAFEVLMPLRYTVVELTSPEAVHMYDPVEAVLAGSQDGAHMLVYARSAGSVRSRFFAPLSGIFEDPATGSAAVALAARLSHSGEANGSLTVSQGEEVGYSSTILVSWSDEVVKIGGQVVHDEIRFLPGPPELGH